MNRRLAAACALGMACAGRDTAEPTWPARAVAVTGITLIGPEGARPDVRLVLAEGRVLAALGPEEPALPGWMPQEARPGRFVIPGLIDRHVHISHSGATVWVGDTLADNLRATLSWGVVGVADLGGPLWLTDLRDAIDAGALLGPRLAVSGPMLTAEGSHPCETTYDRSLCVFVDGDGAAQADALLDAGVDQVKVALQDADFSPWPTPRLDLGDLAAICAAGPAVVHIGDGEDAADALAAGCGALAHTPFGGPLSAAEAALPFAELHSTVSALAGVPRIVLDGDDLSGPRYAAVPEAVLQNWRALQEEPHLLLDGFAEESAGWAAQAQANLGALVAADAPVLAGSDAGYYLVPHGAALHDELLALVSAGMSPHEALMAATRDAALALGWTDLGVLAPGARASFLVLGCDPLADLGCAQDIEELWLDGVAWTPAALREAPLVLDPGGLGGLCLTTADCGEGEACDRVQHACVAACGTPYDDPRACDMSSFCAPSDGLASTEEGACLPADACDWRAQDCGPSTYAQTCLPMDLDTSTCWPAGLRGQGETCSASDPSARCEEGHYCSPVSGVCLQLCDPDGSGDPCAVGRCRQVYASEGSPWFGLCW
ncbi:amidohydrolase family protein [Myxococcota bacterium]|nr:amidohydrolase family protein [Myxococcota bacterium]